ncbi:hypothetical protein QAD02_021705 [Eretmocerus hayati]|uniref:Uncharacterized protein n=2 Tax=Eretmocerus hayati TaxID=131215 RepID=A0ACC2PR81_9HYME|nr:hypothetical protein QAD02_015321 [Eretmocerus hayati]KAJ8685912.1 hypothetical protein QAD02_021705 [Eretmocerus hayati]
MSSTQGNPKKTRASRSENFTPSEEATFVSLLPDFKKYIECKQTDAKSREEKNRGWENLVEAFNIITTGIPRTEKNLRNLWDKLKKKARKADKADKKETEKTVAGYWDEIWICEISTCSFVSDKPAT